MTNFQKQYERANPEQKKAIDTIEGPVMVIAGPGTGKTQTLALRIANILQKTQIDPRNILCLTFTDNAALEMLNRLKSFIGADAYKVKIYTFHAFCEYLMSSHLEKFPQISGENGNLDESDRYEILLDILKSLPLKDPFRNIKNEGYHLRNISQAISTLKKEAVSPEKVEFLIEKEQEYLEKTAKHFEEFLSIRVDKITDVDVTKFLTALQNEGVIDNIYSKGVVELISEHSENLRPLKKGIGAIYSRISNENYFPRLHSLKNIYEKYQDELVKLGKYDFEDMIMFVLNKLTQDEEFLRSVQEEFQYILVDEYQDTNSSQNEIIEIIGSYYENPNIFVVGDDDQSIYRFQGANLENILQFSNKYKDSLQVITLKSNYRSQPYILEAARSIITNAENRLEDAFRDVDKTFSAHRKAEVDKIDLTITKTEEMEAAKIAEKVKYLIENGTQPREIAVITSKNSEMDIFAEHFLQKGIPYQISKTENIADEEHIINMLVLIEYLINPGEERLLARILYMPYFGFSPLDIFKIINHSQKKKLPIYSTLSNTTQLQEAEVENCDVFTNFLEKISTWCRDVKSTHPGQFFPILINESGILEYLAKQDDNYLQLNNFHVLYDFLKRHLRSDDKFDFQRLLEKVELIKQYNLSDLTRRDVLDDSKVNILTVHKAKGMEFEHVFIPKMLSRLWEKPRAVADIKLPRSINTQDYTTNEQDERVRLFFVALTRAKDHLHLSYSSLDGNGRETKPSWFVSLIDEGLMNQTDETLSEEEHAEVLRSMLTIPSDNKFSEKGKMFLKTALESFSLSPTAFRDYRECPHCFFLKYIARIPQTTSVALSYGNTAHKALDDFLSKFRRTQVLPNEDFLVNSYLSELSKQFLDEGQIEILKEQGSESLRTFYKEKLSDLSPTSLTEVNFSKFDITVDEVPIKGKIDRIDFVEGVNNVVDLVDYKTGSYDSKKVSVKGKGDYYVQLLFYKLLVDNYPKYNWKVRSGKIIYVDPEKGGKPQKDREIDLNEEDMDWLREEIKKTYKSIMNADFSLKNEKDCYNLELHNINFSF